MLPPDTQTATAAITRSIVATVILCLFHAVATPSKAASSPYCILDLGEDADPASYAVSFADKLPDDFQSNSNAYKSSKIILKWIEPKPFRMGQKSVALPSHNVTLTSGYYLGVYEITQTQWTKVMRTSPFHFTNEPYCPAEKVSWEDIRGKESEHGWPKNRTMSPDSFLGRLNQLTDKVGRFDLPTEAQWEYACRAGTTNRWSYGESEDDAEDYSWTENNSSKKTHDVGLTKPNQFGLYDMHGNVWEWCLDCYGRYSHADVTDPTGPDESFYRVWRGGEYGASDYLSQSANRGGSSPDSRARNAGFRLALQPSR